MSKWEERKLVDLCHRVVSGGTPLKTKPEYYEGGTIPWLKTGEVKKTYIYETEEQITQQGLSNSSAKLVPENSVIIAMYGDGDTAGNVAINKIDLTTNQACCNLILNPEIAFYRFIYFYLKGSYSNLVNLKLGGSQQNLNAKTIKSFPVQLPPLPVQKKIAAVLSAYDDLIENNTRRIALLEKMAKEIYREWFVRLRFPGHKQVTFHKGIPERWEVQEMGNVARITMGLSPKGHTYNESGKGIPLVNGPVEFSDRFTKAIKWTTAPTKVCKPGDLIVCVRGSTTGRNVKSDGEYCLGRGVCAISSEQQSFVDHLFAQQLPVLLGMTSGSTFPSWTGPQLKAHQTLVSPVALRSKFDQIARPMSHAIQILARQNEMLARTRDRLLTRLISGKLPVEDLNIHFPPSMTTETSHEQ